MGDACGSSGGCWVWVSTRLNDFIPVTMMTISEGSGDVGAMGVAPKGRRRGKCAGSADGRWQMGDGGRPVGAEIVGVAGPGGAGDARAAGVAGALSDGQEPERSGDSQLQAARRANDVRQCPSYLGVGGAGGLGVMGAEKEEDAVATMEAEEVVVELHVRQGRPLREVARALGVDGALMPELWRRTQRRLAERAPQREEEFTALREQICAALWQTVECTFPKVPLPAAPHAGRELALHMGADGQMELPLRFSLPPEPLPTPEPPSAPMLTVRLRALDQLAKLYDVGVGRSPSGAEAEEGPYAMPEEIAEAVRLRMLEMHGRRGDGARV